ncbi:OLC1v1038362C1 [Oldenlandia corymbosa var. corymbosa]|uniref:OLC1v1038362C1 n=1 Tax=Oldenlandia corymbosa var. corymbosa TaxID=529605 RepID=A0AAV1D0Q3_OLDCO|nr:OLC1v1038362C1 [Oldenlandia corymbosa var. corymbosa]
MEGEESIPDSKRRRIEETVVNILKESDLETATEHSVRAAASQLLGSDLSDGPDKWVVRRVIESFLLSTAADMVALLPPASSGISDGRVICKLSDKRNVALHDYNGKALVSIRDYYEKDGKQLPSGRGITLTGRQWSLFRDNIGAIEKAISNLDAKIRSSAAVVERKQSVTDVLDTSSGNDIAATLGTVASDQSKQITLPNVLVSEAAAGGRKVVPESVIAPEGSPTRPAEPFPVESVGPVDSQGDRSHNWTADIPRQSLTPLMTTRLDGKNYHSWVHLMEFFLNQVKVAYVLRHPCPSTEKAMSFEEAIQTKAAIRKWNDDEYICRHYILNSLCDNLFVEYSKKGHNAKDLWEELKLVYSDEDFGTARSQISKYVHFQMVDGISVVEQIQELQRILNAIMSSGIWIDENFHASVIISKLPPSWKDYRAKLMAEDEVLPCNMLMHRLKLEEESRNQRMKDKHSLGVRNNHQVPKPKNTPSGGVAAKKKVVCCYTCGKEGHISKYCPDKMKNNGIGRKENENGGQVTDASTKEEQAK